MRDLLADTRVAARSLARTWPTTAVAVLTLTLAIGAPTAIFSVVRGVLLRPLPVPSADRLVALCESDRRRGMEFCGIAPPTLADAATGTRSLERAGLARSWPFVMKNTGGSEGVDGAIASAGFLPTMGARAHLGRLFDERDEREGRRQVAVLARRFWATRFGSDPGVIGQALTLDGARYTIIGVLADAVPLREVERSSVWVPLPFDPRDEANRQWPGFRGVGRLRPGATMAAARAELDGLGRRLQPLHFADKSDWTLAAMTLHDSVVGSVRTPLLIFLAAVTGVLLIGCVNVANLLLASGAARGRELAVRAALGASRGRLVRLLMHENLLLAAAGGAGGILLATWATPLVVQLAPGGLPRMAEIRVDGAVLLFACLLCLGTAILFGIAPSLWAVRSDVRERLGAGDRTAGGRRTRRLSSGLVVAEITVAIVLVVAAGLLTRTFASYVRWDPGLPQERLLTMWTLAAPSKYEKPSDVAALFARVQDDLGGLPGVAAVGTASAGPFFGGEETDDATGSAAPVRADGATRVQWFDVGPGFFRALGRSLVRGREIAPTDDEAAPSVAVINEEAARRLYPGVDPIGAALRLRTVDRVFRVVGVVRDLPPFRVGDAPRPEVYWSNRQLPRWATYIVIRMRGTPASVTRAVRARLAAIDPDLQVSSVVPFTELVQRQLAAPRFNLVLVGAFAMLALLLAAIGTYGMFAHVTARRRREFGIRLALGATGAAIRSAVLRDALRLTTIALGVAMPAAFALTRLLRGMLAGVAPSDPLTYALTVVVLTATALVAAYLPARRASRADPVSALKDA